MKVLIIHASAQIIFKLLSQFNGMEITSRRNLHTAIKAWEEAIAASSPFEMVICSCYFDEGYPWVQLRQLHQQRPETVFVGLPIVATDIYELRRAIPNCVYIQFPHTFNHLEQWLNTQFKKTAT